MAVLPDFRIFPTAPDHRAEWAPIYLEPMHGSGERIVVAVVATDSVGAFHVELAVRPRTLRCVFGDRGELVMSLAELVQESMQEHLAMGGNLQTWTPPVRSCFLGPVRKAVGADLAGVALRGASLTASFSGKVIEDLAPPPEELSAVAPDVERWLQQIKVSVTERSQGLGSRFNAEVRVKPGASATRIGYLGDRIAANFDLLVPGPNLSTKRVRSKSRLVDLQILKDQVDLFARRSSYELMLWVPDKSSPAYTDRQLEATHEALSELEAFGDQHELRVRPLSNAQEAAEHILALEQPA